MGKYFKSDADARMWAATKLQSMWRVKQEREKMALLRKELSEYKPFDVCQPVIRSAEYVLSDARKKHLQERRFREDAGDGLLYRMKKTLKSDPSINLSMGHNNETAGHRAAENGHDKCLSLCVDHGMELDGETTLGNTAAHYAAYGGEGNGCIRLLSDNLADIMKSNNRDETPITISAEKGKESTMELIRALAVEGEDLVMKRRRHVELKRQKIIREKKGILLGRDVDGSEGGVEFVVPYNAHLNEESKYTVACGLRSAGVVQDVLMNGKMRAEPIVRERKKLFAKENKQREIIRSLDFLKRL